MQRLGQRVLDPPPCFDDGLHVVQAGVASNVDRLQSLVDLCGLLELHDLLSSLQQTHVDVGDDGRQATPLLDGKVGGDLNQTLDLKVDRNG